MKKLRYFFFCVTVLIAASIMRDVSGQTISYEYDATGNRITRVIYFSSQAIMKSAKINPADTATNDQKSQVIKDEVGDAKILIYPNPTRNILKIELKDCDFSKQTAIYLISLSGNMVRNITPASEMNVIDLSTSPGGVYILYIVLNGKTNEWKVVKE